MSITCISSLPTRNQEEENTDPLPMIPANQQMISLPMESLIDRIANLHEEMYLHLGRTCHFEAFNPNEIKNIFPKKGIREFESASRNITLMAVLSLSLKKSPRLSLMDTRDNDEEESFVPINCLVDFAIHRSSVWFKEQLASARVSSPQELLEKSAKITSYKMKAEQLYLSSLENLERRKEIEQRLLNLFELNTEERGVVVRFWKYVMEVKEGGKALLAVENRTKDLFLLCQKRFSEIHKKIKQKEQIQRDQIIDFPTKLYSCAVAAGEELAKQLNRNCTQRIEEDQRLILSYCSIRGKMMIYSLLNRKIRTCIEKKFKKIEELVNDFAMFKKKRYQNEIEFSQYSLKGLEEKAIKFETMAQNSRELGNEEDVLRYEKGAELFNQLAQEERDSIEKYQDKLFRQSIWELASDYIKVDPQMFESTLIQCRKTPFEKLFIDSHMLAWGPDFIDPNARTGLNVDRDINIDLQQIGDPITFLVGLIKQRDEARLALHEKKSPIIEEL